MRAVEFVCTQHDIKIYLRICYKLINTKLQVSHLSVKKFQFLNYVMDQNFKLFAAFNKFTVLLLQYECIQIGIFRKNPFKLIIRSVKNPETIIF